MLTIDVDVLAAARDLAARERHSIGEVLPGQTRRERNGIPLLPVRQDGKPAALELVNRRRDNLR